MCNFFIGGCTLETTEFDISGHCSELGVVFGECENLATKAGWYRAFRIVVDDSETDDLLSAEFWPEGVFVRKFYTPRRNHV